MAREPLSQAEAADRLAVHEQTLGKYERDKRLPDASFLIRLHNEFGVRFDWLLTGIGPMRQSDQPEFAVPAVERGDLALAQRDDVSSLDEELVGLLVDGIMAVYKEENVGLPPRDLGRLAARMHGDLVEAYDDPEDRKVAVKGMLAQLRRDLREAPIGAETKRQA